MEMSMKVIAYANGNPLALEIYGQELKGKMSEMDAAFVKLKKDPPHTIRDGLRSVYNSLGEEHLFGHCLFLQGRECQLCGPNA